MEIAFSVTREDYWQLNKYVYLHVSKIRDNFFAQLFMTCFILPLLFFASGMPNVTGMQRVVSSALLALTIGVPVLLSLSLWGTKRWIMSLPSSKHGILGERTISIGPDGLREQTPVSDNLVTWNGVSNIVNDKKHIYIFLDTHFAQVIPKRAFSSYDEAQRFFHKSMVFWKSPSPVANLRVGKM